MPKTCENHFTILLELFSEKNGLKNTKDSRNEGRMKIGHLAKIIAYAKAIVFAKCSVWVKI